MEILLFVMILIITQGHIQAVDVFLSCPNHTFNSSVDNFITGWFDSSGLANASCVAQLERNEFVLRKGSVDTKICDQDFSISTVICNTNYNAQNCKCDNTSGTNYSYTLKFVANSVSNAGNIILQSDCVDSSSLNIFQSQPCSIDFATTPSPPTTTATTVYTTPSKSTTPECENCNCNGTCKCPDNCSPCPVWCIVVVSVCVPVGGGLIITITVIIIKSKKVKKGGNRSPATSIEAGHTRTKLQPIAAPVQVENKRTEPTVQDTKEMQDRNTHLGTDNSPEKEKRRKKKIKKKTFQVVDGEYVSREAKSTVNDHNDAEKSQNVANENSHATVSGDLTRVPVLKISHLTSVERNSTNFQSETPRKLPPLQPKQ